MQYKPMTIHAVAATYDVHVAVCTTGCLKRKKLPGVKEQARGQK